MCVTNALGIFPNKSIQIWTKTGIFISYVFYKNKKVRITYIINKNGMI